MRVDFAIRLLQRDFGAQAVPLCGAGRVADVTVA